MLVLLFGGPFQNAILLPAPVPFRKAALSVLSCPATQEVPLSLPLWPTKLNCPTVGRPMPARLQALSPVHYLSLISKPLSPPPPSVCVPACLPAVKEAVDMGQDLNTLKLEYPLNRWVTMTNA